MQTNQETPSPLERSIEIAVPTAEINKDVQNRLKRIARTVKMPGFRPGKVPLKVVEQSYGYQAHSEAIGAAIEKKLTEQIQEQNLRIAGSPRIEPKDNAADQSTLLFNAIFEVYPEVILGDLSSQQFERPVLTVSDVEVDKTIEVLRKQRASFEPTEEAAKEGDKVVLDYTGRKDGEIFEGGKGENSTFIIGSGGMLKDFESAIIGLKAGEEKTFDLTFPEDYHAKELAGQSVQFHITLKKVDQPKLPEVNADFAKALGVADGDVEKLREEVKNNLKREVKTRIRLKLKDQVMEALLATTPVEAPKALIASEAERLAENARRDLEMRGMQQQKINVDTSWFTDRAEQRIKLGLIMSELIKAHNLHAKPEQVRSLIEEIAETYENPEELVRWYYAQPDRIAQAEAVVIEDNIVDWVTQNAQITDKAVELDELMSNPALSNRDTE